MTVVAPKVRVKGSKNRKAVATVTVDMEEGTVNLVDKMLLRSYETTHFRVFRDYRGRRQYLTEIEGYYFWATTNPARFHNGRTAAEYACKSCADGYELVKGGR